MTLALTSIVFVAVAALLIEGFVRRERFYQFPFLAGAITFAFVVPQMPGVAVDPFLPDGGYLKVCVMAILCLLMLRLGWSERARPLAWLDQSFSEPRLLVVAAGLSAVGSVFYFLVSRVSSELTVGVQMTGAPVMYLFFAQLLIYGLAIAAICFARRPSLVAGIILTFDLALCIDRLLVSGKRAEAVEIFLICALALWFHKRWVVPRWLVLMGLVVGAVGMSSMSEYRDITRRNGEVDWKQVREIQFTENFEQLLKSGGSELRNAVHRIDHIDRNLEFDYGAVHWNRLVFSYVPAQIVGTAFKDSLMLSTPDYGRNYQPGTGTTETGMTDAFQSFWYFGALKFLLLSYLISRIWATAKTGSTSAQLVYVLSIVPAIHAVSHLTDWVVQVWVHMLIFLAPPLLFAVISMRSPARAGGLSVPPDGALART